MRRVLRAEWTKFRTVRGWVGATVLAAGAIVSLGLLPGAGGSCGTSGPASECHLPVGPGGEEVTDTFTFAHQGLTGDGRITARIAALTAPAAGDRDELAPGLVPWAKAGLIVKDGTRAGSSYAAVMVTGGHGVRLQYDFTGDVAGPAASPAEPTWLRLTRTGATVTGETSRDGTQWTKVGSVELPGLPSTVEVGLFVTSPQYSKLDGAASISGTPTEASAAFDHVERRGSWTGPSWTDDRVGGGPAPVEPAADGLRLTGSGDIAPAVSGANGLGTTITQTLVGTFLGLLLVVVVATLFATAEYRRGLIRTTIAASPRRGQVLAAKAIVAGAVTVPPALVGAAIVVTLGQAVLRGNGVYVHATSLATQFRVIAGTAALLAVAAMLAVGLGTLLRRSVPAVTTAIVVIVLPYLLAMALLPAGPGQWLLRLTPAAAFSLQQTALAYPQVDNLYVPANGYFPLAPWAGLAVLAIWTAVALAGAAIALRRREV